MSDSESYIDFERATHLCDAGNDDYWLAVTIGSDGAANLVLAEHKSIGNVNVTYDPTCRDVEHEQLGALPIEFVKRLTIAARTHRCGQRTKAGTPCRTLVSHKGATCAWHRTTERNHA
jgi:hypothetical protein